MKIAILSEKGLEELVDERLRRLTPDQRLRRAYLPRTYKERRFEYIPRITRYIKYAQEEEKEDNMIVTLAGPCAQAPDGLVATTKDERRFIKSSRESQLQLVVLDDSIHIMRVRGYGLAELPLETEHNSTAFLSGPGLLDLWKIVVEKMTEYFCRKIQSYTRNIALFGCEEGRDKLMQTFEKLGLKEIPD